MNGFGSYCGVPIHGVEGELMGVAVGEIDVKAEGAAAIPGRGNSVRTAPGLQRPRIGGAGSPGVVELILHGHGITIGSVDAMPTVLRGGIGSDEAGDGRGI